MSNEIRNGETWLMRVDGFIRRVRVVNAYKTAVEVEERSPLIGWSRPYIVHRNDVTFLENVSAA